MQEHDLNLESHFENFNSQVKNNQQNSSQNTPAWSPLSQKKFSSQNRQKHNGQDSNLEQENNVLKNQIEMLKSVLMGLCKDQNIQLPLLNLLDQTQDNSGLENILIPKNSVSPNKTSPTKQQFKALHSKENNPMALRSLDKHNLKDNIDNISPTALSKSSQRRNRVDRQQSLLKDQSISVLEDFQKRDVSPKELPLQMKDKSKIFQEQSPINYVVDNTEPSRYTEKSNVETCFETFDQQDPIRESKNFEDDDVIIQKHEQKIDAQIMQIKYAKILEQLELQSEDRRQTPREIEYRSAKLTLQKDLPQVDDIAHVEPKGHHVKQKNSSQFERQQFYEFELTQLKTELEQFEKEEEKILSNIIECSKSAKFTQPQGIKEGLMQYKSKLSPKNSFIIDSDQQSLFQERQDEEQKHQEEVGGGGAETGSYLSISALVAKNPSPRRFMEYHDNEKLMSQVEEETKFLNSNPSDSSFEPLIRPIRINSPTKYFIGDEEEKTFRKEEINLITPNKTEIDNQTEYELVTPFRQNICNLITESAQKTLQTPIQALLQTPVIKQQLVTPQKQIFQQNPYRQQSIQSSIHKSPVKEGLKLISSIDRKKNTSNASNYSLKCQQKPTKAKCNSPYKYLEKQKKKFKDSNQKSKTNQNLDQLAKKQALEKGLQQQEDPYEDDIIIQRSSSKQSNYTSNSKYQQYQSNGRKKQSEKYNSLCKNEPAFIFDRSIMLKSHRVESIKKAEELLNELVQCQQSTKRPSFIEAYSKKGESKINQQQQIAQEKVLQQHYEDLVLQTFQPTTEPDQSEKQLMSEKFERNSNKVLSQMEDSSQQNIYLQCFYGSQQTFRVDDKSSHQRLDSMQSDDQFVFNNDFSFQDKEVAAINMVRLHHSHANSNNSFLNVEIQPSLMMTQPITQELQSQQESPRLHPEIISNFQNYKSKTNIQSSLSQAKNQLIQMHTMTVLESSQGDMSPMTEEFNTFGQRGKSHEDIQYVNNQKFTTLQQNVLDTKNKNPSPKATKDYSTTRHSPFQQFTIMRHKETPDPHYLNNTTYDFDTLYEYRSKSVVKRREELIKQRELKYQKEIEAKYQKIDRFRNNRNEKIQTRFSQQRYNPSRSKEQAYSKSQLGEQQYADNTSQISVEHQPLYKTNNFEQLRMKDMANSQLINTTQSCMMIQRQSLPGRLLNQPVQKTNLTSINHSNINSILISECPSQRISDQKQFQKTPAKKQFTNQLFKKDPKHQKSQNKQMRIGLKEQIQMLQEKLKSSFVQQPTVNKPNFEKTQVHNETQFIGRSKYTQNQQILSQKLKSKSKPSCKTSYLQDKQQDRRGVERENLSSKKSSIEQSNFAFSSSLTNVHQEQKLSREECQNCIRLVKKGISTDFCLQH